MWTDEAAGRATFGLFSMVYIGNEVATRVGMVKKLFVIGAFSICTLALAAPSHAQHRGGSAARSGSGVVRGGGSVTVAPRGGPVYRGGGYGYRGYYYPRYSFGFYAGYPYYSPYYYPYGYYGGSYGYPYYGGAYYGGDSRAARGLGSVQIKDAPKHAQVFADNYYAGNVDDFDGVFQHLDLEAGEHHIEIRQEGQPPIAFDVNVQPGETITYHAREDHR